MYKFAKNMLLPLFLLNITCSANRWEFFPGLGIGQLLLWAVLILSLVIVSRTPYRILGMVLFIFFIVFGAGQVFLHSIVFEVLKVVSSGIIYVIAGAEIYGEDPEILNRQFKIFFAISIPIMLLQITGAHSFFMGWDTEYGHDTSILDVNEYGKFIKIAVYPTLFVGEDDLFYQIGQGRPCGLLYSNNVLSVFIAIATGLNFGLSKSTRIKSGHLIIATVITLCMSLTGLFICIIVYLGFLLFGAIWRKKLAFKMLLLVTFFHLLYYFFFPGLFLANYSSAKLIGSLITRGLDLANSIGFSAASDLVYTQRQAIGSTFDEEASYSLYSMIFKSEIALPLVTGLVIFFVFYFRRLKSFHNFTQMPTLVYTLLGIVCILTQFAVNYVGAPSYQFILGLALYPILKKLWIRNEQPALIQEA